MIIGRYRARPLAPSRATSSGLILRAGRKLHGRHGGNKYRRGEGEIAEYVVAGLIWDAAREQTLIQLIQKVILSPLKAAPLATPVRPLSFTRQPSPRGPDRSERNHNQRGRRRERERERARERPRKNPRLSLSPRVVVEPSKRRTTCPRFTLAGEKGGGQSRDAKLFLVSQDSGYQRADRLFLSRFRSRKLAREKGGSPREKAADLRPR